MRSDRYKEEPKPKKKKRGLVIALVVIALLLLAIAGVAAYSYKTAKDSISLTLTDNDFSVEFGKELSSMDFVSSAEGDVTPAEEFLETGTVGDKEMVYTVTKPVLGGLLKPSGEYSLRYTVVDDVPPLIYSRSSVEVERGTDVEVSSLFAYGDNADPKPALKIDGDVDLKTSGSYPIHVTVTDASGNKEESDITVEVVDSMPEYEDDRERTTFEDFVDTYKGGGKAFGIDVSGWQGDVDFEAVKKAGCEFVIMRIGYTDEGSLQYDSKFRQNYKAAKAAGLKIGLYMFSYDNSAEGVEAAADTIIEELNGEKLDLPIAFDWEDFAVFQTYEMSFYDLNKLYDVFEEKLNKAGYETMLYSSLNYLENIWTKKDKRPVWLAQYADKPTYKGKYMLWQAMDTGRIDGIDGDVDLDILMPQ